MDVEDVVMKIFVGIGEKFWRYEVEKFFSWLMAIVWNDCMALLKKCMKDWVEEFFEKNDFGFMEFLFFDVFYSKDDELE